MKTIKLNGKTEDVIELKEIADFWTNSCENQTGMVVKMIKGSLLYRDQDGDLIWMPKRFVECNPNLTPGYNLEVELISDQVAHRIYVNPESRNEQFCFDINR